MDTLIWLGVLKGLAVGAVGANLSAANGFVASGITAYGATAGNTYTVTTTAAASGKSAVTLDDGNGNTQTINVTIPTAGTGTVNFKSLGVKIAVNTNLGSSAVSASNTFAVTAGTGSATLLIGANNTSAEKLTVAVDSQTSTALLGGGISVATQTSAQNALATIDSAIASVSTTRATLGALQNRLEHTITNLGVGVENLSASESRIRDTDVAEATSRMVSAQILSQAGTSVLAQANSAPQGALSLLRGG